ncbi:MAG: hypothetical protein SGARI_004074, partial [Bacillariaceae sp.]
MTEGFDEGDVIEDECESWVALLEGAGEAREGGRLGTIEILDEITSMPLSEGEKDGSGIVGMDGLAVAAVGTNVMVGAIGVVLVGGSVGRVVVEP